MTMQTPAVVAQLPRPFDLQKGRICVGEVCSLANSKKRKRSELCIAVDGATVNFYNAKSDQFANVHPVPPESSFTCPPLSIITKSPDTTSTLRRTFCVLRTYQTEITLFSEARKGSSISYEKKRFNIPSRPGAQQSGQSREIIALAIVPNIPANSQEQDEIDVITIQSDGQVRRLSGDLQTERWNMSALHSVSLATSRPSQDVHVHGAFLIDLQTARKSVLLRRENLLASLESKGDLENSNDWSILVLVYQPSVGERKRPLGVSLSAVPWDYRPSSLSSSAEQRLVHLTSSELPEFQDPGNNTPIVDVKFHPLSATLLFATEKELIACDISMPKPKVVSSLRLEDRDLVSFVRLSKSTFLASTSKGVASYNMQYKSVQASLDLENLNVMPTKPQPKQSSQGYAASSVKLLTYYPNLNIAVAIRGPFLLTFQLPPSRTQQRGNGLLIDSIGRGVCGRNPSKIPFSRQVGDNIVSSINLNAAAWATRKAELDALLLAGDVLAFEESMIDELNSRGAVRGSKRSKDLQERNQERQNLNLPGRAYVDWEKLQYLLSKIFSLNSGSNSSIPSKLTITCFPSRLFRWLVTSGRLTKNHLELALQSQNLNRLSNQLTAGSVTRAVLDFDPSLEWLIFLLQESQSLSADERVLAIKALIRIPDRDHPNQEPLLLTNGFHYESSHAPLDEQSAAKNKTGPGTITPDLLTVTKALNIALIGLHNSHSRQDITQSFRTYLTRIEMFTILDHLRLCLASGGWTSRFADHHSTPLPDPDSTTEPPSLPLKSITVLLNCIVDAVGQSGFLSLTTPSHSNIDSTSQNSQDEMDIDSDARSLPDITEEDLIPFMRAEVSAALAGVEEASYLRGILREFLRHVSPNSTSANPAPLSQQQIHTDGAAKIVTLVSSRPEGKEDGELEQALPLSLKADQSARDDKTRLAGLNGERVKLSVREMKHRKRMRVGKYSFERIVV